jgi:hypothetical protein
MTERFVLDRTGQSPVAFNGSLIVQVASDDEDKLDRGFAVSVWKTDSGTYVAHVRYLTKWKTEAEGATVYVADNAKGISAMLRQHNPLQFVVGYPPGKQFAEKQARLEKSVLGRYGSLIGKMLTNVPGAEDCIR